MHLASDTVMHSWKQHPYVLLLSCLYVSAFDGRITTTSCDYREWMRMAAVVSLSLVDAIRKDGMKTMMMMMMLM